jgi:hypothetical protein
MYLEDMPTSLRALAHLHHVLFVALILQDGLAPDTLRLWTG